MLLSPIASDYRRFSSSFKGVTSALLSSLIASLCFALDGAVLRLKIFFLVSGVLPIRPLTLLSVFRYLSKDLLLSKILLFLMLVGDLLEELS